VELVLALELGSQLRTEHELLVADVLVFRQGSQWDKDLEDRRTH